MDIGTFNKCDFRITLKNSHLIIHSEIFYFVQLLLTTSQIEFMQIMVMA